MNISASPLGCHASDNIQRDSVLDVRNLSVEFATRHGSLKAVDQLSFDIKAGEVLGVVGESGAGKSLTGSAVLGLLEPPGRISAGEVWLSGRRIDNLSREELRQVRGREIGMIFQDPLTSLNPLFTVGRQLVESICFLTQLSGRAARRRAVELLGEVGIPAPEVRIDQYPHQFSGGMRQRVVIALALCGNPKVVIADEPTTALDVSVQSQIMKVLKRLCANNGTAVMLITHDMGVIAETADRVAVLYAGRMAEIGEVADIVRNAKHPYTRGLMESIPRIDESRDRLAQIEGAMPRLSAIPPGCAFHTRCRAVMERCVVQRPPAIMAGKSTVSCWLYGKDIIKNDAWERKLSNEPVDLPVRFRSGPESHPFVEAQGLVKHFDVSAPLVTRLLRGEGRSLLKAVDGVNLRIPKGRTFSLVGESGCGKSTVARLMVGLYRPSEGSVFLDNQLFSTCDGRRGVKPVRSRIQMIFQDPYASLNPRWRVRDIVAEPIRARRLMSEKATAQRVRELLDLVKLNAADGVKYPHEFSGGQRQRISIARALASEPDFLVCDEPTSALDVSVQAQILNLMKDLQQELDLTYLFISHDLAVVHHISDFIGVMYLGRIVEWAPAEELFHNPQHPYTRMLLAAIPDLDMRGRERSAVKGEVPNPMAPPEGCHFHVRCPFANERCRREPPEATSLDVGEVRCHAVAEGRLPATSV